MATPFGLTGWVDEENDQVAAEAAREAAAEAMRRGVRGNPRGGRSEGTTTKVFDAIGEGLYNSAARPSRIIDRYMNGYVPGQSVEDMPDVVDAVAGTTVDLFGAPALLPGSIAPGGAVAAAGALRRSRGLPMDEESRIARMNEQGYQPGWYHGGERMDRFTESGKIDPRRATSGPMPYFTDDPAMASSYATKKADTSLQRTDTGNVADYFTVDPKAMWPDARQRTPVTVEQSWNYLPPELKAEISDRARRIGYANSDGGDGPLTLHPAGAHGGPSSADHWEYTLKQNRGNPLAALRNIWHDGGMLVGNETELANIYKLAGYPHAISEARAPWTEARGVFPAALRMRNPLATDDVATLRDKVVPALEEAFKRDRTRLDPMSGSDMWDKNNRWTPREWTNALKSDLAKGDNSFVWTSIPDKVTAELTRLGYDGIMDMGGKMGGQGHRVAIPFRPNQVRSKFARFDPANEGKPFLLGSNAGDKKTGAAVTAAAQSDQAFGSMAPLPMDEASRMARARELGFDTSRVSYHGSPDARGIDDGFKSKRERILGADDPNRAFFFTDDARVAKSYADPHRAFDYQGSEPAVVPAYLKMTNPKTINWEGKRWRGTEKMIEEARVAGHDGVVIKNVIDDYQGGTKPTTVRVVFNPEQVRKPQAAFDPANKDSGYLLGSNAGDKRAGAALAGTAQADRTFGSMAPEFDWKAVRDIESNLPPKLSRVMDDWVGGPVGASDNPDYFGGVFLRDPLTRAVSDPVLGPELEKTMQPVRDALRARYGDTVPMYRYSGEVPEGAKPHDLLSMTSERRVAEDMSGARRADYKIFSTDDIAKFEAELAKSGEVQIGKHYKLVKGDGGYLDIMDPRAGGFVTDTPSVQAFIDDLNRDAVEGNAARVKALSKVSEHHIPVDDVVAATDRFNQREFIVRNRGGLFANKTDGKTGAAVVGADLAQDAAPMSLAPGIRAYHGSPYDFDRFDMSKIGTGEGAQAYGHGLYFAENPETAKAYRSKLAPAYMSGKDGLVRGGDVWMQIRDAAQASGIHPDQAGTVARRIFDDLERGGVKRVLRGYDSPAAAASDYVGGDQRFVAGATTALEKAIELGIGGRNKGRMYEVNINAKPEQFLDWDKPLGVQQPIVDAVKNTRAYQQLAASNKFGYAPQEFAALPVERQDALIAQVGPAVHDNILWRGRPGRGLYDTFESSFKSDREATARLRDAGIPGIRYLDHGSRAPLGIDVARLEASIGTLRDDIARLEKTGGGNLSRLREKLASEELALAASKSKRGTSNYVLFDDKIIDILRKYAIPGMIGGAGFGSIAPGGDQ